MSKKGEIGSERAHIGRSRVPRKREWEGISLTPIIAEFEVPLDIPRENMEQVSKAFEKLGDGALIFQASGAAGVTWILSATYAIIPSDADCDLGIDGESLTE